MPDYYGTGKQPKSGRSYVGLAVTLVIVLLAANALPFVIPCLQQQKSADCSAPTPQQTVLFRGGNAQEAQTAVCGMRICELDAAQQRYWQLPGGVIVSQVDADSAAARAGILPGDVILRIGAEAPQTAADCRTLLSAEEDGAQAELTLYRCGQEVQVTLTYANE